MIDTHCLLDTPEFGHHHAELDPNTGVRKMLSRLKPNLHMGALFSFIGTALFLMVVIPLHFVQQGYNPRFQLLSELALGEYGWMMLFAFIGLALSAIGAGIIAYHTAKFPSVIWGFAALCFLGAGIFPLGESDFLHIALIASAFVLSVLGMFVFARQSGKWASGKLSYLLAVGMTFSIFLGSSILDMGIAQRLAALCLLIWFVVIGYQGMQTVGETK